MRTFVELQKVNLLLEEEKLREANKSTLHRQTCERNARVGSKPSFTGGRRASANG